MSTMFPREKASSSNRTVGGQVEIWEEVVGVGLTEIVPIQVQGGKADGSPEHDLPVNLPH